MARLNGAESRARVCVCIISLMCLGVSPAWSQTFTFIDDPLVLQTTVVKTVHIVELRQAVNTRRSQVGLGPFSFTDPTLTAGTTPLRRVHVTELRTALDAVFDAVGQARPLYTDSAITTGVTVLKRAHVIELRTAVNSVIVSGFGILSLSQTSLAPARLLGVNGTGFDTTGRMRVIFTDSSNRSIEVPAVNVTATSLQVPVPPFVNSSGQLATGAVSVKAKKVATSATSNAIAGFQILAAPSSPLTAGRLVRAYLNGVRSEGLALKAEPLASAVKTGLDTSVDKATQLLGKVQSVINDPTQTFSLGTFDGKPLTVTAADLAALDRMLLAQVQAVAAQSPQGSADPDTPNALIGEACLAAESQAVAQAVAASEEPFIARWIHAPRATVPCATAVTFNTTSLLVGGAGAVAVGALALLGATPMALALSGAALLYITVTLAGAQIGIGGALNQTTGGGGQLVQQGVKQFNDMLEDLIIPKLPGSAGDIVSIITGVKSLQDAFETTTLPPPAPPPPRPAVTGIAFISTGSTTSAQVSPVVAAVSVYYSLVGTDGYTQSGTVNTNASGIISFSVPAGLSGVRDTVVVTVVGGPSATATHTWGAMAFGATPRVPPPR